MTFRMAMVKVPFASNAWVSRSSKLCCHGSIYARTALAGVFAACSPERGDSMCGPKRRSERRSKRFGKSELAKPEFLEPECQAAAAQARRARHGAESSADSERRILPDGARLPGGR